MQKSVFCLLLFTFFKLDFAFAKSTVSFMTYNAGLAHTFVAYAKERTPEILKAIKQEKSDVLCLQEVWNLKDRKTFIKELKREYPYSHYVDLEEIKIAKRPACAISDLFGEGKFVSCMQTDCKNQSGDDFTSCIIQKCQNALINLKLKKRQCAQSLMAQVGKNPLWSIVRLVVPLFKPSIYSYKSGLGTMIFSRFPFVSGSTGHFDLKDISTLNRRGILYGDIEVDGSSYHLQCTHLTANLTQTAPYAGQFSNWEEENLIQTEVMIPLAQKLGKQKNIVLMGDFNAGPEIPSANIKGDFEASYNTFIANGFTSAFTQSKDLACSTCRDNNLNDSDSENNLIDHIFLKLNEQMEIVSKRVLTEKVEIKLKGKDKISTNLSDHYGIKVILN